MVASRQWPGVFWVHNDSGDEPRIYPTGRDGKLKISARKADAPGVLIGGVVNSDWEDIAVDSSGRIIIADVGNNSNAKKNDGIFDGRLRMYIVRNLFNGRAKGL